jgi:hypothetical protein
MSASTNLSAYLRSLQVIASPLSPAARRKVLTLIAEARAMAAEQGRIAMAALGELARSVYRESLAALIDEQLRREA